MTNFKSGSGNLDFGSEESTSGSDGTDAGTDDSTDRTADERDERAEAATSEPTDGSEAVSTDSRSAPETGSGQRTSSGSSVAEEIGSSTGKDESLTGTATQEYPYFVRRRNVGDERDTRLEIHVRDKVAEREGSFRSELAEHLDASEVSKTDAREFALLVAFRHPERVAELMREEGFGIVG